MSALRLKKAMPDQRSREAREQLHIRTAGELDEAISLIERFEEENLQLRIERKLLHKGLPEGGHIVYQLAQGTGRAYLIVMSDEQEREIVQEKQERCLEKDVQ